MTDATTTPEVKAPKAKASPKAKAKKPAKKVKAKKPVVKRPARDDARIVASASDGKLTTDQVRQLRALKSGKLLTIAEIKAKVGLGDGKYSGAWLKGLHALVEAKYIAHGPSNDERTHVYEGRATGKAVLERAEKAAKS